MPSKALLTLTAFLLAVFSTINLQGQLETISGTPVHDFDASKDLNAQFSDFGVYRIDANYLKKFARSSNLNIKFNFELGKKYDWTIAMTPHNIKKQDFQLRIAEEDGVKIDRNRENITYKGYLTGGNSVRMTINDDFIYGLFEGADDTYYIEPLHYLISDAPNDLFIVYSEKGVTPVEGLTCGVKEEHRMNKEWKDQIEETYSNAQKSQLACYDVEIALAADWILRQAKGSVTGTQNFMTGVLNNVATNYDDEFTHDMILISGNTFIPNSSSADPFTTSTDYSALLNSFTSWGGSGFGSGSAHDVATLWTGRNLSGSVVGVAWVGGTCTNSRYNVCQDIGGNAWRNRVLQAHELGHNFDAGHDGATGWVMSPSVNNTSTWSNTSISEINSFINRRIAQGSCFSACSGGGNAPVADFNSNVSNPECEGATIDFVDQSSNNPDTWLWDFGDGNTSTQQDPSHTYSNTGFYDVSLTASNSSGSDTYNENDHVEIIALPLADFIYTINLNSVDFIDQSSDTDSWFWDFDNGVSSTAQDPTAFFNTDGFYDIELTASNSCGTDVYIEQIEIVTPPTAAFTSDVTDGCAPLTVQFTDQSSYNTTNVEWFFPTGSPSFSTSFNPTVTFDDDGPHDVTLIAFNSQFQHQIDEPGYILVAGGPPVADFNNTVNLGTVTLTDQSLDATSIEWDFGDGATSFAQDPIHTYTTDGTYTITQTVDNICGVDVKTEVVTIVTPPTADFDAADTEGCAPFTIDFFNYSSSNVSTFEWSFPGGTPATSTDEFPTIDYLAPGTYDVTLKVSNSLFDDTYTRTQYIIIDANPIASFTSSTNQNVVDFTNTSQNFTFTTWNFGDGNTSSLENPTHTYANDGTYTVELEVENNCSAETITQTITVVTQNTAGFTATPTNGCTDLTVQFSNTSSANSTSYLWTFPGGTPATSTDANPTVVYSGAGSFDVTLEASNAGFTDVMAMTNFISTSTTPTPGFTSMRNNNTVTFTNTATGQTGISWDFGDGNTSSDTNPVHTYANGGTYTVVQTTTNGCGSTTATEQVNITLFPTAGFSANATTGCTAFTTVFNNTSSSNSTSYAWSFPGGNPSTSTDFAPTVIYTNKGTYDVTLIVSNSAGTDTLELDDYITVEDVPTSSFSESIANFTVATFTNTSADAASYEWIFGDGNTSTMMNPVHDYGTDGVYNVELKSTNNCGTVSSFKTLTIVTPPTADFTTANLTSGCTPYQVQYTSLASANATSIQWNFPGGTPSTSTNANPMVTYNTPGTFNVELLVVNSAGNDTELKQNFMTVETTPTAGFTPSVNLAVATFANTSTGGTSVSWDFGDGNSATDMSPTHTYGADGTYSVIQSVTNNCGTVTSTQSVTIVTPPTANFNTANTSGCEPFTVQFNNMSSANAATYSWTFPGGTPATSTDANPTVVYNTKGNYDVELTVSNSQFTDTEIFTQYIDVNGVPVAAFAENTNLAVVNFTNNSVDATSYSWNFGDGNTSTDAAPTYTYGADGTYDVVLSATNACGTVTSTQTVSIVTPPTANFNTGTTSGCAPFTVQYNNQSSANAATYSWTFQGGTPATSTDANPTVVYNTKGIYDVELTVSNSQFTDTEIFTQYIDVSDVPVAAFAENTNLAVVNFTNNSVDATSYSWDFGDGNTSTDVDPTHTYAVDGIYNVVLSATNACGTVTSTQTVLIATAGPLAAFDSDVQVGCAPLTVNFMNSSSSNTSSVQWTFTGGDISTSVDNNPTVTYNTPGVYDVTLIAINSIGNDTVISTSYIEVLDVPAASFSSNLAVTTVDFTNASSGADSYSWDFGDGNTSTDPNPTNTFPGNGTYNVVMTATNACGTTTFNETITINGTLPSPDFSADVRTICIGDSVAFMDMSGGTPDTWNWTLTGGTPDVSTMQNPTVVYNTAGSYGVTLDAGNIYGSSSTTQTAYIEVVENPIAGFTSAPTDLTVDFSNGSIGGTTFSWDFGDGNSSTDENPMHTYTASGTYTVLLSVTNACGTVTHEETVTVSTSSLNDLTSIESLNIYPNPNEGQFTVEINGTPTDQIQFRVLNGLGQLMKEQQVDFRSGYLKHQFDLNLSSGIYMLQIQSNGETGFRKIEVH